MRAGEGGQRGRKAGGIQLRFIKINPQAGRRETVTTRRIPITALIKSPSSLVPPGRAAPRLASMLQRGATRPQNALPML